VKNAVCLDVTPSGSCKNRRPSDISDLTRATRRDMPEDGILQHGCYLNKTRGSTGNTTIERDKVLLRLLRFSVHLVLNDLEWCDV
jgi:hypothetical protein